jgi:hypothetical protein
MTADPDPEPVTLKEQFLVELARHIADIDVDALLLTHPDVDAIAKRMIASLPNKAINEPPVGACFTTSRLATWRNVTRQAIFQGRRAGRIFGFLYEGSWLYPDVQFGPTGSPLPVVRGLLAAVECPLTDAKAVANWLDTRTNGTSRSPRDILLASRAADAADRVRWPERFSPALVLGPSGDSGTPADSQSTARRA